MTVDALDTIKAENPTGWRGVFHNYPAKKMFGNWPFISSLVLILFIVSLAAQSFELSYNFLIWVIELNVSLFPNLLGFSLGCFAILIGFSNINLLKAMTRKQAGSNISLFQYVIGIFAFSLILQSVALVISYVVLIISKFEMYGLSAAWSSAVNIGILFVVGIISLWAILLLPNLILNIFTFGQLNHFNLAIERSIEDVNEEQIN